MLMMRYLLPLMLVLATCWAGNPIFESVAPKLIQEVSDDYRLPKNVVPTNYVIELTPYINTGDKKNFTFDGKSEIDLQVKENDTKTITFHAKNITLNSVNLTYTEVKNKSEPYKREDNFLPFKKDELKDFIIVTLKNPIHSITKDVKLSLSYTGVLNDELRGFYRSSYKKGNETRWLATTHFEPVGARQAFPCWDEPAIKATFNIIINIPENIKNYKVVSNMLESPKSKKGTTIFQQTPKMSTYLVAFVVSDYEVKRENAEEKRFGVWTRPDAINSTEFALEIGNETLKKLDEFTGIKYYRTEATKMDQISIPDFAAGAMENWGLVTYRETALLYTENKTTTQDKQAIATVIAHEFSHQWFGNLVTCDWWDYIWLNEGFATFFQYYTTEQVVQSLYNESWRLMDQFVIKNLQESAFVVDATDKTRPLNSKNSAKTPDQIHSLFDDIAYKKGASILRMLQQFLKEDVFQKGLQRYLSNNTLKSVTPSELFKAIQDAEVEKVLPEKVSLDTVMHNWLNEPGYPVVNVTRIKESEKVNLTQERFFLTKPTKQAYTIPIEWYIPITYVTKEAPKDTQSLWMKPNATQTIDNVNNETWILVNKNQTGYYRVNYDTENWNLLATYLREDYYKNISDTNRAQLIDDALNLARMGYLTYDASLRIIQYLSKETDYIPWYAAVRAFNYLDNLLQGSENLDKYHAYVAKKIKAFAKEVKYNEPYEGTHVTKLGKKLALITACKYGQKDCEDFAKKELEEWLKDKEGNKKLSPDLRSGIICAGLRKADAGTWNKTVEKYKKSNDVDERLDILMGLGCATSKEIIKNFLDLTIKKDPFTDTFSAIDSIFEGNVGSFDSILDFINEHIEITKKANEKQFTALLNKLATRVTTIEQYGKLSLLADLRKIDRFTTFGHAIENLAWVKSYQKDVGTWFVENQDDDPSSASSFTLASFLVLIPVLLARFN